VLTPDYNNYSGMSVPEASERIATSLVTLDSFFEWVASARMRL
jgi:hypothetical protein